jgi:uncharacterized protein (DUF488 family)
MGHSQIKTRDAPAFLREAVKSGHIMPKPRLFTIGYQQSNLQAVLATLKKAKVQVLADVRAIAASRKPGFSKTRFATALDEAGIAYLHLQKLGTPAQGRKESHAGHYEAMWRIYDKHLKTHAAVEAMDELLALVRTGKRVCLLCFEHDPAHCHRSRIAAVVHERTGAAVEDLIPPI